MGANQSSLLSPVSDYIRRKRRKLESESESNVPSPKKFCPEDTIYEQCFLKGVGHDIVVKIFDKEWKLHKESLIKSPYFASMFSGSWNESTKSEIEIKIPNPKITETSINIVLGSLYHPNVSFEEEDIFSVIAAATLFQLDELVNRCEDILLKSISCDNVLLYYEVAQQYSLQKVQKGSLSFLLINLVLFYISKPQHLRSIDCDLMQQLISSPKLVTSSPLNVYRVLRLWLYLKLQPTLPEQTDKLSSEELVATARNYFQHKPKSPSFLCSCQGAPFVKVFESIELFPLISARSSIVEIQEDNILPQSWLTSVYAKVCPIVADMMHPTIQMAKPMTFFENYAVHIRETQLNKHGVKWSTVLPRDEICTPRNRSSWLTWTLHSYGLVTDWKFTGSSLKVMFTPNSLYEGNIFSDNDIKYVPLYCRFTIYALGASHQELSSVSKSATSVLEKFRHEDLLSFCREDFPMDDEQVTLYILSLQVFVVHRVILYKLMRDNLCDRTTELPSCDQPDEVNPTSLQVVVRRVVTGRLNNVASLMNDADPVLPPAPPPNQREIEPQDNRQDNDEEDSHNEDSDVDVEGDYFTDSSSGSSSSSTDDSTDSSDSSSSSSSSSSEPHDHNRVLPRLPTPPRYPAEINDPAPVYHPSPSPFIFNSPRFPSSASAQDTCPSDGKLATGQQGCAELRRGGDDLDEDSLVRIVIPKNIHTDTCY
uniref:Protein germ cell-less n=1 Tax=Cacopsylla melanoneura TaxID=428564 RepID=A0A8D8V4H6_9HEMI